MNFSVPLGKSGCWTPESIDFIYIMHKILMVCFSLRYMGAIVSRSVRKWGLWRGKGDKLFRQIGLENELVYKWAFNWPLFPLLWRWSLLHWKHCLTKHRDGPRLRSFRKWSKIPKVERIGLEATLLRKKFLLSLLPGIRLTCKCFDDSSMWAWNPLILVGIFAFVENSRSRYFVSLKKRILFYVELTQLSIALWIGHCTVHVMLCSLLGFQDKFFQEGVTRLWFDKC